MALNGTSSKMSYDPIKLTGDVTGTGIETVATTVTTGTSGSSIPRLNGANTWTGVQTFNAGIVLGTQEIVATTEFDNGNSGSTATINFNNGNQQKITLTANCTFSFTAPTTGVTSIRLRIIQGAGGPWTITWPTMTWAGGVKPPTATAAAKDIAAIEYSTIDTAYEGVASLNFS